MKSSSSLIPRARRLSQARSVHLLAHTAGASSAGGEIEDSSHPGTPHTSDPPWQIAAHAFVHSGDAAAPSEGRAQREAAGMRPAEAARAERSATRSGGAVRPERRGVREVRLLCKLYKERNRSQLVQGSSF